MRKNRIILADDHKLLLDTIRNFIEPEFEVVGTFTNGQELVDGAQDLSPDVIILDVGMPIMNGLNAGSALKHQMPKVKLIYLTMNCDQDTISEAFRAGASGYVLKTSAASELVTAIREVLHGGYFATPELTDGVIGSFVQKFRRMEPRHALTLRQNQVLQLLVEGCSMKEISEILDITPRTVAFHKYTMMENLEMTSSAELIRYGMKYTPTAVPAAR
jgi:DNA-binding NarL/FixJ family response regulator